MASIQERLQLKRVPLDTWNIREQLCLASAVVRSGDQNWMSVSRALKTVGEPNRPPDWYSQKSCAAQYGSLLEHVETPKRKKRSSEGAVETPQESIVKRLTQDRIAEIQKNIVEMNQQYEQLKNEISEVRNQNTSEERLKEIWSSIEATKRAHERESARRAAFLKEREERRALAARNSAGSLSTPPSPSAAVVPPSSPLLTSLLKSSPVVTTPQHIPHPATVVDTVSPSVTAPTLSMLLEKSSPQQDSKRAAIEHIKSQLVQIEQQLKANTPPPVAAALDIDDIEINAEDVYVFRDVDIHIPTVTAAHTHDKPIEKPLEPPKKDDMETVEIEVDAVQETPPLPEIHVDKVQQEPTTIKYEIKEELPIEVQTVAEVPVEEIVVQEEIVTVDPTPPPVQTEEVKISFPEVKFPTTEIKIIQPDEQKIKEEKEPEISVEEKQPEVVEEEVVVQEEQPILDSIEQQISDLHAEPPSDQPQPPTPPAPPPEPTETTSQLVEQLVEQLADQLADEPVAKVIETGDIPLPPDDPIVEEPPLPPEEEEAVTQEESLPEVKEEPETEVTEVTLTDNIDDDVKREEDAELSNDSIPLKQMIRGECMRTIRDERIERIVEDTHTETDDDTPMELSREEEKDGKKRRDYSRKKKPDSRTWSGSSSAAEASAPESPNANTNTNVNTNANSSASASEADRQHRLWKKSVMLVYTRLCAHKYASLFLRPISDAEAPGYSVVVKRPMDLSTIRRHIDTGVLRTTAEFQRAVLLMLSNALMYNSSEHSVYTMAKEMHEEAASQLSMLLAAQAHAGLVETDTLPSRRKRRHPDAHTPKRQH